MKYNVYVNVGGIEFEVSGSYVRGGGVPPVGPELDVVSVKVGGKEIVGKQILQTILSLL